MKSISRLFMALTLLTWSATSAFSEEGSYTSITLKKSVWSGSSYVGDLSEWVHFHDGNAKVVEYRAPESSFSFSASMRETEDGGNELESLVGATRLGDMFLKLETGGADGQLHNANPDQPVLMPTTKTFTTQFNMLAIGKEWRQDTGVKYGMAWIHLIQPAEIDLTYHSISPGSGSYYSPTWARSTIDPEFSTHIVGGWFDIDSLNSFMKGQGTLYSSPTISGNFIRGFALDWEMVFGLYFSDPGTDLAPTLKEAYGLDYEQVDSTGIGWANTYKIAYNLVYRAQEDLAFGFQMGIEGRALQTIIEFPEDKTVERRDQAIGKIGIGDNSSYQWGPYVRLAMVF